MVYLFRKQRRSLISSKIVSNFQLLTAIYQTFFHFPFPINLWNLFEKSSINYTT
jgi:hypothetical protein